MKYVKSSRHLFLLLAKRNVLVQFRRLKLNYQLTCYKAFIADSEVNLKERELQTLSN